MELTEKMTGWFDVRRYKEGKPKDQRQMLADDENITFTTTFRDCPEKLKEFAKEYADKDGNQRWRVSFKIGRRCGWFDREAKQVERPANVDLEGKRFEVRVQYNVVRPKNPNDTREARGYWANAIQFQEVQENPFEAFAPQAGVAGVVEGKEMPPLQEVADDGLPF